MGRMLRHLMIFFFMFLAMSGSNLLSATQDPSPGSRIYEESSKSVLLLIVKSETGEIVGQGTGFLVTGRKIVTNEHVIRVGKVFIDLGAAIIPVKVERVDYFNDLALLSADAEIAGKPLLVATETPNPGTNVYAIGNPIGLEKSISAGMISGVREFKGRHLLQLTTPLSKGSSGGPILNIRGEVVGVAVGILEEGQNLNFAVPAKILNQFLRGEVESRGDVIALLDRIEGLKHLREQYGYSSDPSSEYQNIRQQIIILLQSALDNSGTDAVLLLKIAKQAKFTSNDIAIDAIERAVRIKPTPEAYMELTEILQIKTIFSKDNEKTAILERAERAARSALQLSKQPNAEIYYHLADVLEDRGNHSEAENNFRRALDTSNTSSDPNMKANSKRGLIRTTYALGKHNEWKAWFKSLIDFEKPTASDWEDNAKRLVQTRQYKEAGQSYRSAALLGGEWTNWCSASDNLELVEGEADSMLYCARKCLSEGFGKKDSEFWHAYAYLQIANVLNGRGVFQEALTNAREASALQPENAWALYAQAEALVGLRRFREAINATNQAIRLSDGKYSIMHFTLGSAYFELENWEFAKQSFEKAAQLDLQDEASPYNVAVCLTRLGYYRDAATWYQEVLRRNPNHKDKQDILDRIRRLRY